MITVSYNNIRNGLLHLDPTSQYVYMSHLRRVGLEDGHNYEIHEVVQRIKSIPNVNSRRTVAIALRTMFPEIKPYVKIEKSLPRVYDLTGIKETLEGCPDTPRFIPMRLMAYGGLRVGEAVAITHHDLTGNTLAVSKSRNNWGVLKATKGASGNVVIPSWLAQSMTGYKGTDIIPRSYYRWLKRHTGLIPHALRHWNATQLIKSGASPELVRRQLRHSNLATTLSVYAQVEASDIEQTIEGVFSGN